MSDAAIKAAVEAAQHAALRHDIEKRIKRGDTLWRDTPPELVDECVAECMSVYRKGHAWAEIVDPVPVAIAAFLRAASDQGFVTIRDDEGTILAMRSDHAHRLAAAVERVAGGGDE